MNLYHVITAIVGLIFGIAIGGIIEQNLGNARFKQEAVSRGFAEWIVNQENGSTTWKWKEPKP